MKALVDLIACCNAVEIENVLKAVIHRYNVLFPDWEVTVFSIEKRKDRNQQIDQVIDFLERSKEEN